MALLKPVNPVQNVNAQPEVATPIVEAATIVEVAPVAEAVFTPTAEQIAAYMDSMKATPQAEAGLAATPEQLAVKIPAPLKAPVPFSTAAAFDSAQKAANLPIPQKEHGVALPEASRGTTALINLADAGLEGLEIGVRSFPQIALKNNGTFVDINDESYGTEFYCTIISSKKKYCIAGNMMVGGAADSKVFFTYDKINTAQGESVEAATAALVAEGRTISEREYTDVMVSMMAEGEEYDSEPRILSVPKDSAAKLSGKIHAQGMRRGWKTSDDVAQNLGDQILHVSVGASITNAKKQTYYPWSFNFVK